MKTQSTETERAAEQRTRNIERRVAYRARRAAYYGFRSDCLMRMANDPEYLERMANNPAFLKVQAD